MKFTPEELKVIFDDCTFASLHAAPHMNDDIRAELLSKIKSEIKKLPAYAIRVNDDDGDYFYMPIHHSSLEKYDLEKELKSGRIKQIQ